MMILCFWTVLVAIPHLAIAADKPDTIPQDASFIAKSRQERSAWKTRTLSGAYDRVGKKDARWDKGAHEALAAFAAPFAKMESI
jgi:hypothetical protein